ncbi:remorin 4.1-like [Chenopodium quinoa]|uniref:remorin 4.1-like n=1 Tax=Chenopodium quinoa TaxID=63459 RepID=UPI000B797B37|nr:remorin 4.1-like [Chenopodium quinoa]
MNPQSPTTRSPPLPLPPSYSNNPNDDDNDDDFRDIHALTPPSHPLPPSQQRMFDANSRRSSNLSVASDITNSSENFTTMSREFNALVIAGSTIDHNDYSTNSNQVGGNNGYGYGNGNGNDWNNNISLDRIGEEEGEAEETNPLAIVPDINPLPSPPGRQGNRSDSSSGHHLMGSSSRSTTTNNNNNSNSNSNSYSNNSSGGEMAIHHVKKEEVETKIAAWQTAKISKINNRFKREDAIISGWENEQVHKASSWMKKIERKLEEKRAKAMEKTQNDIAKARRKAEERRASAEGKRGTKVARVLEVANLMRAVGRPPAKRSFF